MSYIDGSNRLPSLKLDAGPPPVGQDPQTIIRGADFNAVRNAVQELLDFAVGGGTRYPLTLTEPVGSSPTTAFRIVDNIGLETFSIKADGSFTASDKFQFGLGEYEPALELLQSTHVYTGNRFTSFDYNWPEYAGGTPAHGLVFITSNSPIQPRQYFPVRSTDGSTWTKGAALGFSPHTIVTSGNTLFTLGSSLGILSLYRSDDGGSTWTLVSEPPSSFYRLRSLADGTLVGSGYSGEAPAIWYSVDEGSSWLELLPPMDSLSSIQRIQNRWILAVSTGGYPTILYSDDGENWESGSLSAPTQGLNSFDTAMLVVAPGIDDNLILIMELVFNTGSCETRIFRSSDLGVTWVGEGAALGDVRLVNDHTAFITSTRYLCVAVWFYELNIGGYVAISTAPVDAGPIQLTTVPIRVDPVNTTGPVSEIHETIEFNGRIYGFGHTSWSGGALARVVWSDDLTAANWLNLSDPITKLAPQGGYLDLGTKYLELTEPLTGAKYFSVEMDEATNTVLSPVGDLYVNLLNSSLRFFDSPSALYQQDNGFNPTPQYAEFVPTYGFVYNGSVFVVGDRDVGNPAVIRSDDFGQTWVTVGEIPCDGAGTEAFIEGGGSFYAVASLGGATTLYTSSDLGATWVSEPMWSSPEYFLPYCLVYSNGALRALSYDGATLSLRVYEGSSTWASYPITSFTSAPVKLVVTSGSLLVFFQDSWGSPIQLTRSTDDGQTWSDPVIVFSPTASESLGDFAVVAGNLFNSGPAVYLAASVNRGSAEPYELRTYVFSSTTDGLSWLLRAEYLSGRVINDTFGAFDPTSQRVLLPLEGHNHQVFVANLVSPNNPPVNLLVTTTEHDIHQVINVDGGGTWLAIGHQGGVREALFVRSLNNGVTWTVSSSAVAIAPRNDVLEFHSSKIVVTSGEDGSHSLLVQDYSPDRLTLSSPRTIPIMPELWFVDQYEALAIGGDFGGRPRIGNPFEQTSSSCLIFANGIQGRPNTGSSAGVRLRFGGVNEAGDAITTIYHEVREYLPVSNWPGVKCAIFTSADGGYLLGGSSVWGENLRLASLTDGISLPRLGVGLKASAELSTNQEEILQASINFGTQSTTLTSRRDLPNVTSTVTYDSLVYACNSDSQIWSSPDGKTWSLAFTASGQPFRGGAQSGSTLIFVGLGGLVVTYDGATWTEIISGIPDDLLAVAWGGGRFIAVGTNGVIATSIDEGDSWTTEYPQTRTLNCVAYNNQPQPPHSPGGFIAAGEGGAILAAPSQTWVWLDYSISSLTTYLAASATNTFYSIYYLTALVTSAGTVELWTWDWDHSAIRYGEVLFGTPLGTSSPLRFTLFPGDNGPGGIPVMFVGGDGGLWKTLIFSNNLGEAVLEPFDLDGSGLTCGCIAPNGDLVFAGDTYAVTLANTGNHLRIRSENEVSLESPTKFYNDATFSNGAILTSPNGTLYRISVDNDGVLTSTPV